MVSVRKTHQITTENFSQWLTTLDVSHEKKQTIATFWQKLSPFFTDNAASLIKSLEMVEILATLNLDNDSLAAAFICPLIDDSKLSLEEVESQFSKQVLCLCEGVQKMEAIKVLQHSQQASAEQVDNIRKMLLAMVEDVRAVVIKLAERLCNLRIIKNSDEETRVITAKEAKLIYAPLANRLGIGQLKWELEDISFRYLHPDVYKNIATLLDEKRLDRESYMTRFVDNVAQLLNAQSIKGEVYGRPKHIYSIWKKMQKKSLDFEQLFDVRAVRIVVDELQACYSALGVIHTNWQHLADEFDDYVATPKNNGYQSIHTVIIGPENKAIEVQIRTKQMHEDAELGVAAHWRYKEGTAHGKTSGFDDKISWLRKILQWQEDVSQSSDLVDELRSQVFEDRIYVFTPKGDVIDLPSGSTPLDFAYYIHSNVGHSCIGAKVFGRIVPFTYKLSTGDQVEILRSKSLNPSRDWLNPNLHYLHTPRARSKVQHFFRLLDRDQHISDGKALLESALSKVHFSLSKLDITTSVERFNLTTEDDLFAAIGSGNVRLLQVVNFIQHQEAQLLTRDDIDPQSVIKQPQQQSHHKADNNGITVSGVGNLMTHIAQCCHPVPGDEISGFITQGRGIAVHRLDCVQLGNMLRQQPEREIDVQWGAEKGHKYTVSLHVYSNDRQGLLRDMFTIITNEGVSILAIESHCDEVKSTVNIQMKIELTNNQTLQRLINKLTQLDDILSINRI